MYIYIYIYIFIYIYVFIYKCINVHILIPNMTNQLGFSKSMIDPNINILADKK